jgi:hypothetical protein
LPLSQQELFSGCSEVNSTISKPIVIETEHHFVSDLELKRFILNTYLWRWRVLLGKDAEIYEPKNLKIMLNYTRKRGNQMEGKENRAIFLNAIVTCLAALDELYPPPPPG